MIEIRCTGKNKKRGVCGKLLGKIKKDKNGRFCLEIDCPRCGKRNVHGLKADTDPGEMEFTVSLVENPPDPHCKIASVEDVKK